MNTLSRDAVADRLKAARAAAKFETAADAARHIGLKPATVRAHESGQNGVSAQMAATYAKAYGVSVNWLLFGDDSGPSVRDLAKSVVHGEDLPPSPEIGIFGELQTGVWRVHQPPEGDVTLIPTIGEITLQVEGYDNTGLRAYVLRDDTMSEFYRPGIIVITAHPQVAGLQDLDHVVIARRRGEMVEFALREIQTDDDGVIFFVPRPRARDRDTPQAIDMSKEPVFIEGVVIATYERRSRDRPQVSLNATFDAIEADSPLAPALEMAVSAVTPRYISHAQQRFERHLAERNGERNDT